MSGLRKTKRPFGLVRKLDDIETVPLDTLSPAELNDAVYKPIDHNDPDVIALAKLIREQGLLEPLVITLDDVILSGHRRRVACQMAGIDRVKVRRHPIRSTDPGFAELLVSYNAQRVKSVDEQVREAVVLTDKKKAYQNLLRHRRERSNEISDGAFRKGMTEIADTDARRRSEISPAKFPMLNAAIAVLNANRDYWPLTLRQVHYRLLNDPPLRNADRPESTYANDLKSYKDLSNLLARARIAGNISWHALHDPTRPAESWRSWSSPGPYIREQIDGLLRGYSRDLLQSQPHYIEVIGEKMTVGTVIERATRDFGMPYSIGRGYSSVDLRHQLAERFRRSGKEMMTALLLSDFDPEGENIGETFAASMRDEFDVPMNAYKVVLTDEQVDELELTPNATAKVTSSRYPAFVEQYGENVYELEAVEPAELEAIVRAGIQSVLDLDLFRQEQEREADDAATLEATRTRIIAALGQELPD